MIDWWNFHSHLLPIKRVNIASNSITIPQLKNPLPFYSILFYSIQGDLHLSTESVASLQKVIKHETFLRTFPFNSAYIYLGMKGAFHRICEDLFCHHLSFIEMFSDEGIARLLAIFFFGQKIYRVNWPTTSKDKSVIQYWSHNYAVEYRRLRRAPCLHTRYDIPGVPLPGSEKVRKIKLWHLRAGITMRESHSPVLGVELRFKLTEAPGKLLPMKGLKKTIKKIKKRILNNRWGKRVREKIVFITISVCLATTHRANEAKSTLKIRYRLDPPLKKTFSIIPHRVESNEHNSLNEYSFILTVGVAKKNKILLLLLALTWLKSPGVSNEKEAARPPYFQTHRL